jgi:hypothetical protein
VGDPTELALDPPVAQRERSAVAIVEDDSSSAVPLRNGMVNRTGFFVTWRPRKEVILVVASTEY